MKLFIFTAIIMLLAITGSTYNMASSLGYGIQNRIEALEMRVNKAGDSTLARNIKVKLDRIETKISTSNISYQDEKQWEDFRDKIQRELSELESDAKRLN